MTRNVNEKASLPSVRPLFLTSSKKPPHWLCAKQPRGSPDEKMRPNKHLLFLVFHISLANYPQAHLVQTSRKKDAKKRSDCWSRHCPQLIHKKPKTQL